MRTYNLYGKASRNRITIVGAFFLLLFLVNLLDFQLSVAPAVISIASGLSLAILVMEGASFWPVVFLGSLAANLVIGAPLFTIFLIPFAHTSQAIIGAQLLKWLRFDPVLRHFRDTWTLLMISFIISVVVPTIGIFAYSLNEQYYDVPITTLTWGSWWTGTLLSLISVAPLTMRWIAKPGFRRTWKEAVEIIASFALLITVNYILFWSAVESVAGISTIYLILIPFMWMALRVGPRFMAVAVFITSAMAITGTVLNPELSITQLGTRLFQTQIFLNIIAYIFFIIVAMEEERSNAMRAYKSHISSLEGTLSQMNFQDKAKTEFIAILAHELRNPLAPLVSSIELLRLDTADKEKTLGIMENVVRTMRRLLDDLLDISRISRRKLILHKEHIDLCEIIRSAVGYIEPTIRERGQKLHINLPRKPIMIYADPVRIEQIVMNLLSNASKFTDEGGSVSVFLNNPGGVAEIRVLDTGIGIDPAVISRIFEPFLQVELGERKNEGLGIGLALTYELVRMHGGTLRADSPGKNRGSEFVVELPIIESVPATESPAPPIQSKALPIAVSEGEKHHKILIVDDNRTAADGMKTLLEMKGHVVACAYNGSDALKCLRQGGFEVVVLDIGLPDMTGFEVAHKLRTEESYRGTIIALSGYGQEEDKQKARESGFDHYLVKPVSIKDIEQILSGLT